MLGKSSYRSSYPILPGAWLLTMHTDLLASEASTCHVLEHRQEVAVRGGAEAADVRLARLPDGG